MKIHAISRDEVKRAISMEQAIETVKAAFEQLSTGSAVVPIRTQLGVPLHDGVTLFMPAYLEQTDELGMKMVSVFSRNVEQGLPTINAMVTLVDAETGLPTAILDGTYLTALRTGAGSNAAFTVEDRVPLAVANPSDLAGHAERGELAGEHGLLPTRWHEALSSQVVDLVRLEVPHHRGQRVLVEKVRCHDGDSVDEMLHPLVGVMRGPPYHTDDLVPLV